MSGETPQSRVPRRSAGELESEVLAVLWATDRPLTPAEIQAGVGGGLAYNTVHTIVKRLLDKQLVVRETGGRRGSYRPAKNAAELTADVMRRTLHKGPDPIAALQQFVTGLSSAEEQALRKFLADDSLGTDGLGTEGPGADGQVT